MPMPEIASPKSGYGEIQILWGADLEMEKGKLTALVGSNGAGKATLLRRVMASIRPCAFRRKGHQQAHGLPGHLATECLYGFADRVRASGRMRESGTGFQPAPSIDRCVNSGR